MIQRVIPANLVNNTIENKKQKSCAVNLIAQDKNTENKNPGALAGATGANEKESELSQERYRMRCLWASSLREAIHYCHPHDAMLVMSDELDRMRIGMPVPPLYSLMNDAESWSEIATQDELKCYALACYNAMPPKVQAGFLAYVMGRAVA
jgi:hypothetical protein